ncbi:hypothetical protein Lal_00002973 [Lupinus albus]|nr:hypothetical protein Lal_00002973 [Lupinus albus]
MGDESGVKPILLKFGLALTLSFAGFIYSRLKTRIVKSSTPKDCSSDHATEVNPGGGMKAVLSTCNTLSEKETRTDNEIGDNSHIGISHSSKQNGEKDEFLLPEFHDLVKELDIGEDVEVPRPKVGSSIEYASHEKAHLGNIRMLQDREQSLEVQPLEYCGLKEQQAAMMELQNRLKLTNMEAKMFNLKVKTLQSENRKLEERVADHQKVLAELEAAKVNVKMLKMKIRYEGERNREQLVDLKQKVAAKLQEQEYKDAAGDQDNQIKLQKLKELESEAEELRKSNLRLQMENSDLARRLDSTHILANSVQEHPEKSALEESERLRKENESLMKEIEQLQADRCSDVEELVYMRWINACLRYELRNYQPPPGKTVARDLSKSLSPTSENKVKQLILEYANYDNVPGNIVDFDLDLWSSSQGSILSDSGEECDGFSSLDNSSTARTNTTSKIKIFSKLRKMIQGKDGHHHRHGQVSLQEKSLFQEDVHSPQFWPNTSAGNDTGTESLWSGFATPTDTSRTSFDSSRLTSLKEGHRRNSDSIVMGNSYKFSQRKIVSFSSSSGLEKSDLKKYAEALKYSGASAKHQRRRRSASHS